MFNILSDPAGENNGVCQEHESSSVMRDISGFDLSFTDVIIYPTGDIMMSVGASKMFTFCLTRQHVLTHYILP